MKSKADLTTIQWLDSRIARIKNKLDGEMKNLADSGIVEGNPMFDDLWIEIQREYNRDILPYAVIRHQLEPFEGEELETYRSWMDWLGLGEFENPPEEMKYALLPGFKKVLRQLMNK